MLVGTVADYMAWQFSGMLPPIQSWNGSSVDMTDTLDNDHNDENDVEPVFDPKSETLVWLVA